MEAWQVFARILGTFLAVTLFAAFGFYLWNLERTRKFQKWNWPVWVFSAGMLLSLTLMSV